MTQVIGKQSSRMVTGFNHNIQHRGRMFHVQTEDSGVGNPHIITHMFLGGNILASKKTSYADIVHAENLSEVVRAMMEEQHKEMLRTLVNGGYEEVIERYEARSWQPGVIDADESAAQAPPPPDAAPALPAAPAAPPAMPAAPVAPPPRAPQPAVSIRPPAPLPVAAPPPSPRVPTSVQARPEPLPARKEQPGTIFGEDLISERSLDEVILSYLAEDTGEP